MQENWEECDGPEDREFVQKFGPSGRVLKEMMLPDTETIGICKAFTNSD